MAKLILFEALYNECYHESSYATISLHRTHKGAEMAIEWHKAERQKEWEDLYSDKTDPFWMPFSESSERWGINEIEVQD
jgi:hypothetical protein